MEFHSFRTKNGGTGDNRTEMYLQLHRICTYTIDINFYVQISTIRKRPYAFPTPTYVK